MDSGVTHLTIHTFDQQCTRRAKLTVLQVRGTMTSDGARDSTNEDLHVNFESTANYSECLEISSILLRNVLLHLHNYIHHIPQYVTEERLVTFA